MFLKHAKLFAPVLNKGWPTKAKIVFHFIYVHNLQFDLGKLWTVFIMNYILCKILKKSYNNLIFTLWQEPMTSNGCFCNVFFTILFFTVILTRQLWRWDKGWATYLKWEIIVLSSQLWRWDRGWRRKVAQTDWNYWQQVSNCCIYIPPSTPL
jgi:hypothetical protein